MRTEVGRVVSEIDGQPMDLNSDWGWRWETERWAGTTESEKLRGLENENGG